MGIEGLAPSAPLLLAGLLLDAIFGDPQVRLHPIRLLGRTLSLFEKQLRSRSFDGYGGGCILVALLVVVWVVIPCSITVFLYAWNGGIGLASHILWVYVLFATRDLVDHVRA